jgi:hypothetical protein
MSNSLLTYNQNSDILDKNSVALSTKKEDLISDNNYNEDSINSQCIIEECSNVGANLIAITRDDDLENYSPYFVCDMHYHELMTRYYSKEKKKNNAIIVNQIQ